MTLIYDKLKVILVIGTTISTYYVGGRIIGQKYSGKNNSNELIANGHLIKQNGDSLTLTAFIRKFYKWHNLQLTEDKGFDPNKSKLSDTLYNSIDFNSVNFMLKKLKASNFFDQVFLDNYLKIAVRMDEELKTKKSKWKEGDLPPFNGDADPWCNCWDDHGKYWETIKIMNLVYSGDEVSFKWTWGQNFFYNVKTKMKNGKWKITYLEGFDFRHYKWAD